MNKNELIEALKESNGLSKAEAKYIVDTFFDSMAEALAKGGRVEVRGLCSFYVKAYEGYTGRNPKTGELVNVNSKKLPFFKPGLDLKDRVDR
jgi:integration host factor subunit beta